MLAQYELYALRLLSHLNYDSGCIRLLLQFLRLLARLRVIIFHITTDFLRRIHFCLL